MAAVGRRPPLRVHHFRRDPHEQAPGLSTSPNAREVHARYYSVVLDGWLASATDTEPPSTYPGQANGTRANTPRVYSTGAPLPTGGRSSFRFRRPLTTETCPRCSDSDSPSAVHVAYSLRITLFAEVWRGRGIVLVEAFSGLRGLRGLDDVAGDSRVWTVG